MAAHEFGHILGLKDVYNDDGLVNKPLSIMNHQAQVKGMAQPIDFAMMMVAWKTGTWVSYSAHPEILKKFGIS